jgi:hypothetical protein
MLNVQGGGVVVDFLLPTTSLDPSHGTMKSLMDSVERVKSKRCGTVCKKVGQERVQGEGACQQVSLPRAERLCRLCESGVGDELHVVAECPAYAAVRQRRARLFRSLSLGGWQQVGHRVVAPTELRLFMSQEQHLVWLFFLTVAPGVGTTPAPV